MIVDQGIFVEYYLDDTHADKCEEVIEDLNSGSTEGFLTDFHLHGVCAIFNTYFKDDAPDEIQDFVYGVAASQGLKLYRLTLGDKLAACEIQRRTNFDFDDAILVHTSQVLDCDKIASLDKHLKDGEQYGYTRLHPKDY